MDKQEFSKMANGHGGKRPGGGRKTKTEELKIVNQAVEAIIAKHGDLQTGFVSLLESQEPSLIKFVWEHAVGKPKEKIEHSGRVDKGVIFILDDRFNSKDNSGIST